MLVLLERKYDLERVGDAATRTGTTAGASTAALASLVQVLLLRDGDKQLGERDFKARRDRFALWLEQLDNLHALVAFNLLVDEAREQGIQAVTGIAVEWPKAGELLAESFRSEPGTQRC